MVQESPLGKTTVYKETYSPELLFPVPRSLARNKTHISDPLPFDGVDIWNAFELSWLNIKGKPEISMATFVFPCTSPNIVESKSLKLYLNSFNQSKFDSLDSVQRTIEHDLKKIIHMPVTVTMYPINHASTLLESTFSGTCLDSLDVEVDTYYVEPKFLKTHPEKIQEKVYSHLLKSNCLATGQPDWGSVWIHYVGKKIDPKGLLKYIISFRNHSGFAEHCVEHIYQDLMTHCCPEKLTVYARYTRRGGLDINPFRSNFEENPVNIRQMRQ